MEDLFMELFCFTCFVGLSSLYYFPRIIYIFHAKYQTPWGGVFMRSSFGQETPFLFFMEPEGSLSCWQEPATGPYPEPHESTPSHPILQDAF
jgi:hypothetical protein